MIKPRIRKMDRGRGAEWAHRTDVFTIWIGDDESLSEYVRLHSSNQFIKWLVGLRVSKR